MKWYPFKVTFVTDYDTITTPSVFYVKAYDWKCAEKRIELMAKNEVNQGWFSSVIVNRSPIRPKLMIFNTFKKVLIADDPINDGKTIMNMIKYMKDFGVYTELKYEPR